MKNNSLVYTQVTVGIVKILKEIRKGLEEKESKKKRNRKRITKREVCEELYKRCLEKSII